MKPPQFVRVPSSAACRLRLFVFPHSGGGAYPFRTLSTALPSWVELSILQLPGREALFGAPMYQAMTPLVEAIVPLVVPQTDVPYAFFGHSLGSHVAFELARGLRARNAPSPRGFIVSATRAPHLRSRRLPLHDLPTPRLIDEIRRYGGTPEAVLQNQELMDIFLPPLRADLTVFETYSHVPGAPFEFPLTAFGGRTDHRTDLDELEAWREHTTGSFSVKVFEGGHFYLLEQSRAAFLTSLRETVETFV
jgi:medium-chain acyl-[acyl-carrier-protein] hydrolase